jgi:hypothetical protein
MSEPISDELLAKLVRLARDCPALLYMEDSREMAKIVLELARRRLEEVNQKEKRDER